jgi:hypothetical protein
MSDVRSMFEAALADYSQITGTDLSQNRFAIETRIGQVDSPEGILLLLLQERAHASNESRNDNQRLTNTLNPTVRVLHALSGNLDEAVGTVSHTCHLVSLFNLMLSGPLSTRKCYICWDRYSPCCTSLVYALSKFRDE